MRILLADDQHEVRSALKLLLDLDQGAWAVEGEASNYEDMLNLVSSEPFDVILLDWELPGLNGDKRSAGSFIIQDKMIELRSLQPEIRIIALSGRPEARSEAGIAGIEAFASKGDPPEALLNKLKSLNVKGSMR
jgi:DNA-binding NarL/FixJ family response regulator